MQVRSALRKQGNADLQSANKELQPSHHFDVVGLRQRVYGMVT